MNNPLTFNFSDNISAIEDQWKKFHSYLGSATSSYDWTVTCAEHLLGDEQLHLVVAREQNEPIAIAPLSKPASFLKPLTQLCDELGEPNDFSYQDTNAAQALANELAKAKTPLLLERMPRDSPMVTAIETAYAKSGLVVVRQEHSYPYIETADDGEQTFSKLSSRLRSDLRRAAKKAKAMGEPSFEIHAPTTPEALKYHWEKALTVEAANWKGREGSALAKNKKLRSFFESYIQRAAKDGILRIAFMKIDDEAVAMQIALEVNQRFWLLKIGYDEAYKKCSPGMLLMEWTLRYAADQHLKSYEFLGKSSPWTARWSKNERENVRILVFPYSLRGMLLFAKHSLKHTKKKIVKKWQAKESI